MVQKQEFYRQTIQEAAASLHTDPKRGLSAPEAERRLWENGENRLPEAEKKSVLQSFLEQLNDPLIYVLLAAALISMLLGEYSDAGIIAFVVCLNAAVGVLQEGKAQRALDSLKQLMQPRAVVIRDGSEQEIPAAKLVVGDLVCLQAGAMVPADLRLVEAENLQLQLLGASVWTSLRWILPMHLGLLSEILLRWSITGKTAGFLPLVLQSKQEASAMSC